MNRSLRVGSGIGPAHDRTGALGGFDNFTRRFINQAVIEGLEPDTDGLA